MRVVLRKLLPFLHLTRITTAFAAIANVWFVILWSRAAAPNEALPSALADLSLPVLLATSAVCAAGLFVYGMALNDVLDVQYDRAFAPNRPLPSGQLRMVWAVSLVILALMVAMLGAIVLGMKALLLCLLTAAAILFYNAVGKFIPAVGLVSLGLIYAAHMMIPNFDLKFVWPVWVVMTHSLLVGAWTYSLAEKRPLMTRRGATAMILGWAVWSLVLFIAGYRRVDGIWPDWVNPLTVLGPIVLAILFVLYGIRKVRITPTRARAAEKITRYGALWLALYDTAWLFGQGYRQYAALLGAVAVAGFLGMTLVREVLGLLERPLEYRR
jgi:4-hydroxybenzoate polyprenyltransferase